MPMAGPQVQHWQGFPWLRARPPTRRTDITPADDEAPADRTADGGSRALTFVLSSGDRTRTCDPVVNSHLLYQLSYAGPDRILGCDGA